MSQNKFPPGWDEERVKTVLAHYEEQSDDEAVAEDEAAYEAPNQNGHGGPHYFGACDSRVDR